MELQITNNVTMSNVVILLCWLWLISNKLS